MRQLLLTLLLLCLSASGMAQAVITPRNMALGGGGSTYITDSNANFYNPANLMIQDREGDFSVTVGVAGIFVNAMKNYSGLKDQFNNSKNYFNLYEHNSASQLTNAERDKLIDDNYPNGGTLSDNRARYDFTLAGLKWKHDNHAYSVALRHRTSSSFRVGKGWYEPDFTETNEGNLLHDRSLIHRYQSLYELSFGYAESFQFLTGLTPRIDNFIIGIAPKLVLGGEYQNADWVNHYKKSGEEEPVHQNQAFSYDASGDFGNSTSAYLSGVALENANAQSFNNNATNINGIGAGLDIGITYLYTLGSDLTAIHPNDEPTQRSLRLSFAMTDIGFVSYSGDEISMASESETTDATIPAQRADEVFTGARGQYADFIEKFGSDNPFLSSSRSNDNFSTLLPMALHGGMLLELNRFKLMGDVSVGLTNNAFNSTKIASSFGMEIRPFDFLPLRGGVRFKAQNVDFLSLGTAIETKKWEFSISAQLTQSSLTEQPTMAGVSAAALQFHF